MTEFDPSIATDPEITFGKYAGSRLSTLPDDYLVWLLEKAETGDIKPRYLNERIIAEWNRRKALR